MTVWQPSPQRKGLFYLYVSMVKLSYLIKAPCN